MTSKLENMTPLYLGFQAEDDDDDDDDRNVNIKLHSPGA